MAIDKIVLGLERTMYDDEKERFFAVTIPLRGKLQEKRMER